MKVLKLSNWKAFLALAAGAALVGGVAVAQDSSVEDRIKPVGQVATADESAAAQGDGDSGGDRSGEEVYAQACSACHAGGVMGAPKKGDAGEWEERLEKGMETLLTHSIEGFNSMPPRGGCGDCSDEEIESALEYMTAGL